MEPSKPLVKGRRPRREIRLDSDEYHEIRNQLLRLAGPSKCESNYFHQLATPLLQVFSIDVHTDFDDEKPCEVYGSVRANGGQGTTFNLYDRRCSEFETILKCGTLSLIDPEGGPILCSPGTTIDVDLKERSRGIEIIKGPHFLDSMTEEVDDSYDKLFKAVIQGEHCFAYVYYTTFRFAIFATVEVSVIKKGRDESSKFADVHGKLVAGYGNSRRYCTNEDEMKCLESTLLEIPSDRPMRIMVGTPLRLSRSVIAVPAYSSLVVKAFLQDSQGPFAGGSVEFFAGDRCQYAEVIQVEDDCIEVNVKWNHAYLQLYKHNNNLRGCGKVARGEEQEKRARVLHGLLPSSSSLSGNVPSTSSASKRKVYGQDMVEVFSVVIGGIAHEISALCGTIKVYKGVAQFLPIFERDQENPEFLSTDKSIAFVEIEGHFAITNFDFQIYFDLRDPIQDLEVSKGRVAWHIGNLQTSMSWFNKRLCSVVQGKHGYAAVYYIVFNYACRATVEVKFFFNNPSDDRANVHGRLFASYSGHDYSSNYDKYYRSRLFDKSQDKSVQLTTGSTMQLSKSVVAVPVSSSLLIEADLRAMFIGNRNDNLCGLAEFEIDLPHTTYEEIRGQHCRIEVSVKFVDLLKRKV